MYSWKERLSDWWNEVKDRLELTKPVLIHMCLVLSITFLITGVILGIMGGSISRDIKDQADQFASNLTAISDQVQASQDEFEAAMTQQFEDWQDGIDNNLAGFYDLIGILQSELDQLQSDLGSLTLPYLAGEFGNYSLHVKAVTGGNFTANVHLHYSSGIGNSTGYAAALDYFYAGVNWTMEGVPSYVCQPAFNGIAWGITDVWFNIGSFVLMPGGESILPVACTGLNTTWVPDRAYVEVFRLQQLPWIAESVP